MVAAASGSSRQIGHEAVGCFARDLLGVNVHKRHFSVTYPEFASVHQRKTPAVSYRSLRGGLKGGDELQFAGFSQLPATQSYILSNPRRPGINILAGRHHYLDAYEASLAPLIEAWEAGHGQDGFAAVAAAWRNRHVES
jgi:hypothetical protein